MKTLAISKEHVYTVDGIEKPGVNEIMKAAGLIDDMWYNDTACLRGTYVHKAVHLHHTVGLNTKTLDSELIPYMDAYYDFLSVTGFSPVIIEEPAYCEDYGYCGSVDLIGDVNEENSLIDIKTGSVPKWVGVQTSAYENLWKESKIKKRFALNLKPTGKWSLIPLNNRKDLSVFLSCLTVFNYKKGLI
jgi:hypothetical protein